MWRCYGSGWTVLERTASAGDLRACDPHLRSILVTGFIYVVSRLVMMIPDWEPRSEMPVVMYAPGGRRLNEYAESLKIIEDVSADEPL